MSSEHVLARQAAIAAKKLRREHQQIVEARVKEKKGNKIWIPHPEGVCSDGMGRYFINRKNGINQNLEEILPLGKVMAHSIEGFLCLE